MVKITWTERAVTNLRRIHEYIAMDSDMYAVRFTKRIVEASEMLRSFPLMGRIVPEFVDYGLREVLFKSYRIVYQFDKDKSLEQYWL